MTASVAADSGSVSTQLGSRLSVARRSKNVAAHGFMYLSLLVAAVPLALVVYTLVEKAASVISWDFLTADIPRQAREVGPGMGPAIVGTLVLTFVASVIAIPLGVLGAVYLNEYGRQSPLARFVRLMSDVMTGVPSIVMGLFIFVVVVLPQGERSGLAGGLALACLMLPIVVRSSEEVLRLVPDELRAASLALGARRWKTTLTVVLPAALSGITSGAMLAIARAAGETAPLILTVGVAYKANWKPTGQNTALSAQIFSNASQPFPGAQDRAWGAALTLVVLVFVLTFLARLIAGRMARRAR